MKKNGIFFTILFLFVLMILSSHVQADQKGIDIVAQGGQILYSYKDYYALVVGVGQYDKWPDLSNAIKDVKEISWFLKRMGFHVSLLLDPTSPELKKALNDLSNEVGQEPDRGIIFYFAGHGKTQTLTDGTRLGWIIPRDCPLPEDDSQGFSDRAISMKTIETYSKEIRSRHVLMFFDSAFSGPLFSLEQPALNTIDEKNALPVRQYIIAGSADEPVSAQGIFKEFLIKGLKGDADCIYDGYITGSELAVYLANMLTKASEGKLHLQYGKIKNVDLARGDFVFSLKEIKLDTGRLFVESDPNDALVRILNIRPRFEQGMELKPGKYLMEVSSAGYAVKKEWITMKAGEDKTMRIQLNKLGDVLVNSLGMKFVYIQPGSFSMGSPDSEPGRLDDEKTHRVTLTKGFYMQTTEVTVGQFRQFIQDTGYITEAEKKGGCWTRSEQGIWKQNKKSSWNNPASWETAGSSQTDSHPVTCVSWNDAQAFIGWLSRKEGATYGLPTEAEWEYACRAWTTTPFSFGLCLSTSQANYGGVGSFYSDCQGIYRTNRKRPIEAGNLVPNPWGLFDMHGNVAEWCQGWYGPYSNGSVKDPQGASSGVERIMRGGHWLTEAQGCRCAKRESFLPNSASDAIGFRVVMIP